MDINKLTFTSLPDELDEYEKSEKDHWVGKGHLVFRVISHDKSMSYEPYEIEWEEYTGCVGGLHDTLGIEYCVNEGILDVGKLKLGHTYVLNGIIPHFTTGDGWTTDNDVEYEVEFVTKYVVLHQWIYAWWWHLVGHRLRNWRNK